VGIRQDDEELKLAILSNITKWRMQKGDAIFGEIVRFG
jgi:hypothetical protein